MNVFIKTSAGILLSCFLIWYFWLDIALLGLSLFNANLKFDLNELEKNFINHYPAMIKDAQISSEIPLFINKNLYNQNAATFLNPMIQWQGDVAFDNPLNGSSSLALSEKINELLKSNSDFTKLKIIWSEHNLDFSWFKKNLVFDHWNLSENAPYDLSELRFQVLTAPSPFYTDLINWTKLYLLYSYEMKQLPTNSKDIDHLASLIFSQQNFVGTAVALKLLELKQIFYKELPDQHKKQVTGILVTDQQVQAVKRLVKVVSGLSSILVPNTLFNKIIKLEVTKCIFLEEALAINVDFKPLFELSYPEAIQRLEELRKRTINFCPNSYAKVAWTSKKYQERLQEINFFDTNENDFEFNSSNKSRPNRFYGKNLSFNDLAQKPKLAKAITDLITNVGLSDPFGVYTLD